jgi:phosphoadenosine phosphosulfate reductase
MILMEPHLKQSKMASTIPDGLPDRRVASEKCGRQVRRNDSFNAGGSAEGAPRVPTPEELSFLDHQSKLLEEATPEEVIAWAICRYYPKLTMATAFGPEGCVILSILAKIEPRVYVFNLDTGYQFKETLELRDRIAARYGIAVELQRSEVSVEDYEKQNGGPVYLRDPDKCCFQRKITVLRRAVRGYMAWMSGIRRDQGEHRAKAPIVGWDKKFGLVKINPLANWTKKDVWKRISDEDIPYNPLHDQGYVSIGCWPCTRAVLFGEDERAGRWSGTAKTECGLHTTEESGSGEANENLRKD